MYYIRLSRAKVSKLEMKHSFRRHTYYIHMIICVTEHWKRKGRKFKWKIEVKKCHDYKNYQLAQKLRMLNAYCGLRCIQGHLI